MILCMLGLPVMTGGGVDLLLVDCLVAGQEVTETVSNVPQRLDVTGMSQTSTVLTAPEVVCSDCVSS